jgi:HlyD family secretion protein
VTELPSATPTPPAADPEVQRTLGLGPFAKKRSRRWIAALVLVGVVLVAAIVRGVLGAGEPPGPAYETEEVTRGDLSVTVTATGTLQGLNTVEVGAEVSGRVLRVLVDFNDAVEVGQVLAVIDPETAKASHDEAVARLVAANAQIAQAKATLDEAKLSLARAEEQSRLGLVTTRDLESAQAAAARAKASYAGATADATVSRATLTSATTKLGKTTVLSPVKGVVLSRLVEPGQTLTAGFTTPILFKLTEDLKRMSLHVYVDEADIGRVQQGAEATFAVDAYTTKTFASKVLSIHNEPRTTQDVVSYEAILSATNDEGLLRPGMTATATIVSESRRDALLVPNAALRFDPPAAPRSFGPPPTQAPTSGPHVWVLDGLSARSVTVEPGASDGEKTEIVSGELAPGARVIVDVAETP